MLKLRNVSATQALRSRFPDCDFYFNEKKNMCVMINKPQSSCDCTVLSKLAKVERLKIRKFENFGSLTVVGTKENTERMPGVCVVKAASAVNFWVFSSSSKLMNMINTHY